MRYLILLMALTTPLLAEAPACLSGPVTKGSVTVSCIDVNPVQYLNGAAVVAGDMGGPEYAVRSLIVRVQTAAADTAGFRITLTTSETTSVDGVLRPIKQTGAVAVPPGAATPITLTYVFRLQWLVGSATTITGVDVEELKSSGAQSF